MSFTFTGFYIPSASAYDFRLPAPGVMVHLSPPLDPPILKGIKVHPDNPFRFDFILDKGDSPSFVQRGGEGELKQEATKLIKYFLASLTIPEKDLWVNLSPYEKDRIIPNSFGLTEMGRDLLAEDYMLKQITASLIYPEDTIGKKFWKRVYAEAAKRFGTTNVSVNTFNKVWILPEKAVVYENAKAGTAYVVESKLKVMLEQDYLSLQKHDGIQSLEKSRDSSLASNILRAIVIPQLTVEVNKNKNFARLRQVYNSLILATWYKKKIKDSILSQVYTDKSKVAGVNIDDPKEKERIYQKYLRAFKKGVFNYIKEDLDQATQETIPRKYFSGGVSLDSLGRTDFTEGSMQFTTDVPSAAMISPDHAMVINAQVEEDLERPKFSLRQPLGFGPRSEITTGQYRPGEGSLGHGQLSFRMDVEALQNFRSLFENIEAGETGTQLKALRPFVAYAAAGVGEEKGRYFKNALVKLNSISTDPDKRRDLLNDIMRAIQSLTDDQIRQVLTDISVNLEHYLYFYSNNYDWSHVEIILTANAPEVLELSQVKPEKMVLRVDMMGFLNEPDRYMRHFLKASLNIDSLWDSAYSPVVALPNTSLFIKQYPGIVKEAIRILYAMQSGVDAIDWLYGVRSLPKSPQNRNTRVHNKEEREKVFDNFESGGQNSLYVQLFRRLSKFKDRKIDPDNGEVQFLPDTHRRIQEILTFIAAHNSQFSIPEHMDAQTVEQIGQLYKVVEPKVREYDILKFKSTKEATTVSPSTALTSVLPSSGTARVKIIHEEPVLKRVVVGPQINNIPESVWAVSGKKRERKSVFDEQKIWGLFEAQQVQEEQIVFVPFERNERDYLKEIDPALDEMQATIDRGKRAKIFLGRIWMEYLIARADGAVSGKIKDKVQQGLSMIDPTLRRELKDLMLLRADVPADQVRINSIAQSIRNNAFLTNANVYLHTEIIRRQQQTGKGLVSVYLLSAQVFDIDRIDSFDVDGKTTTIRYLGRRIDNLDEQVHALGFTYMGDEHGVVVKEMVKRSTYQNILPHLNNAPIVTIDGENPHPLFGNIRLALQRDYGTNPNPEQIERILESRYRSTAIHEQQHKEDEINGVQSRFTNPIEKRIAQETTAYLRSGADDAYIPGEPNAPYTDLVKIIELFLSYQFNPLGSLSDLFGIYKQATQNDLILIASQLGLSITPEDLHERSLDAVNQILEKALELANRSDLMHIMQQAKAQAITEQRKAGQVANTAAPEESIPVVKTGPVTNTPAPAKSVPVVNAPKTQVPLDNENNGPRVRNWAFNNIVGPMAKAVSIALVVATGYFVVKSSLRTEEPVTPTAPSVTQQPLAMNSPNTEPEIDVESPETYEFVRPGFAPERLARQFGISTERLGRANFGVDLNRVRDNYPVAVPGETIRIRTDGLKTWGQAASLVYPGYNDLSPKEQTERRDRLYLANLGRIPYENMGSVPLKDSLDLTPLVKDIEASDFKLDVGPLQQPNGRYVLYFPQRLPSVLSVPLNPEELKGLSDGAKARIIGDQAMTVSRPFIRRVVAGIIGSMMVGLPLQLKEQELPVKDNQAEQQTAMEQIKDLGTKLNDVMVELRADHLSMRNLLIDQNMKLETVFEGGTDGFLPDGRVLTDESGLVEIHALDISGEWKVEAAFKGNIVTVSPDGRIWIKNKKGLVQLWKEETKGQWKVVSTLKGKISDIQSLSGGQIVIESEDGGRRILQEENGKWKVKMVLKGIRSIEVSSDGRAILIRGEDGSAKIWKKGNQGEWKVGKDLQPAKGQKIGLIFNHAQLLPNGEIVAQPYFEPVKIFKVDPQGVLVEEAVLDGVEFFQTLGDGQILVSREDGSIQLMKQMPDGHWGTDKILLEGQRQSTILRRPKILPNGDLWTVDIEKARLWKKKSNEALTAIEGRHLEHIANIVAQAHHIIQSAPQLSQVVIGSLQKILGLNDKEIFIDLIFSLLDSPLDKDLQEAVFNILIESHKYYEAGTIAKSAIIKTGPRGAEILKAFIENGVLEDFSPAEVRVMPDFLRKEYQIITTLRRQDYVDDKVYKIIEDSDNDAGYAGIIAGRIGRFAQRHPDTLRKSPYLYALAYFAQRSIRIDIPQYSIFSSPYFQSVLEAHRDQPAWVYSVSLSAFRLLNRLELPLTEANIRKAVDLVVKLRDGVNQRVVFGPETIVYNIHDTDSFPNALKAAEDLEKEAGVVNISSFDKEKGINILGAIANSDPNKPLTVFINLHGLPDSVGYEDAHGLSLTYSQIEDALIARASKAPHKSLGNVNIIFGSCYSTDLSDRIYGDLSNKGIDSLPMVWAHADYGVEATNQGSFDNYPKVFKAHRDRGDTGPFTWEMVFETENAEFPLNHPVTFMNIPPDLIKKTFGKSISAPKSESKSHLPPGVIEIGQRNLNTKAEEAVRLAAQDHFEDYVVQMFPGTKYVKENQKSDGGITRTTKIFLAGQVMRLTEDLNSKGPILLAMNGDSSQLDRAMTVKELAMFSLPQKIRIWLAERSLNVKGKVMSGFNSEKAQVKVGFGQDNILSKGFLATTGYFAHGKPAAFFGLNTSYLGISGEFRGWRTNKSFFDNYGGIFNNEQRRQGRIYVIKDSIRNLPNYNPTHSEASVEVDKVGELALSADFIEGIIANQENQNREVLNMYHNGKYVTLYLIEAPHVAGQPTNEDLKKVRISKVLYPEEIRKLAQQLVNKHDETRDRAMIIEAIKILADPDLGAEVLNRNFGNYWDIIAAGQAVAALENHESGYVKSVLQGVPQAVLSKMEEGIHIKDNVTKRWSRESAVEVLLALGQWSNLNDKAKRIVFGKFKETLKSGRVKVSKARLLSAYIGAFNNLSKILVNMPNTPAITQNLLNDVLSDKFLERRLLVYAKKLYKGDIRKVVGFIMDAAKKAPGAGHVTRLPKGEDRAMSAEQRDLYEIFLSSSEDELTQEVYLAPNMKEIFYKYLPVFHADIVDFKLRLDALVGSWGFIDFASFFRIKKGLSVPEEPIVTSNNDTGEAPFQVLLPTGEKLSVAVSKNMNYIDDKELFRGGRFSDRVKRKISSFFANPKILEISTNLEGGIYRGIFRIKSGGYQIFIRYYKQDAVLAIIGYLSQQNVHAPQTDKFDSSLKAYLESLASKTGNGYIDRGAFDAVNIETNVETAGSLPLAMKEAKDRDRAMKGGIDLTPANMHLQTQNAGEEIKFHMDPAMLKQLQSALGFVPVVISIQPLKDLIGFLNATPT